MNYNVTNDIGLRVEVLRNGGVYTVLEPYTYPTVTCDTTSALKMSFQGEFLPVDEGTLPEMPGDTGTYTVTAKVSGADYGFTESGGVYTSGNGGVANSAAVAKIDLTVSAASILTLSCISNGESNYDYGVIYALDTTPSSLTYTVTDSEVYKSFKGEASATAQTITLDVPAGTHSVYLKYRKDSSQDTSPDLFSFRVVSLAPADGVTPDTVPGELNWMVDRVRPVLIVNGVEYPCGVFVATTLDRHLVAGHEILSMEAYSPLYLASRVQIEGTYTIAAGTNYLTAVQELLRLAGITNYEAEDTTLVLATDRADWEVGTPVLDVINELLAEINYNSAWVDLTGCVQLTKYAAPSVDNIQHTYTQGQYSIVSADATATTDYFSKANVFRAVCSSPDLDEPLVATTENSDPNSTYSTVSMGVRILQTERVDSVPDLATLQERAENMLTKSMQTTETVNFVTALCPVHTCWNTVGLDLGEITGIYTETGWSMVLDASGEMSHTAERVVFA